MDNSYKDDQFLARWLNGALSPEELKAFEAHPDYPVLKRIASEVKAWEAPDFEEEENWTQIKSKVAEKAARYKQLQVNKSRRRWVSLAVAASVILFVGIGLNREKLFGGMQSYVTEVGQIEQITLSDGSMVQLNAKSELTYTSRDWTTKRIVQLKGEAYLEVRKGNAFAVETPTGTVNVLGTAFTVNSQADWLVVQCFEGRVRVEAPNGDAQTLAKGQAVRFQSSKEPMNWNIDATHPPKWEEGLSRFEQTVLPEVLDALERQFGIEIEVNSDYSAVRYTGSFVHDDLLLALKMVLEPLNLSYERQGNKVLIP
ncbi:MAG: FecR domain-containing protein [Bacteroidota bacterium]